jgi:hypothetical protein
LDKQLAPLIDRQQNCPGRANLLFLEEKTKRTASGMKNILARTVLRRKQSLKNGSRSQPGNFLLEEKSKKR